MIERRGHINWLHKTLCKYTTFQALVVLWRPSQLAFLTLSAYGLFRMASVINESSDETTICGKRIGRTGYGMMGKQETFLALFTKV